MRRRLALTLLLLLAALPSIAAAQDLTIAAASDLQSALPQIVSVYEQQTGRTVRVTFGSSGNFFAQIQNGAPFDLFFSADIDYPRRLEEGGLAETGSAYVYGTGRLVLWTPSSGGFNLSEGLLGLLRANVRRVAIANPEHAPYGRAAVAALRSAGIYERVQPKLVLGENVSQAAQFAQSGNAQAGIFALSLALMPAMSAAGSYVSIPAASYPPIDQAVVIIKASTHKREAQTFLQFIRTPTVVALLKQFGFEIPPAR